MNKNLPNSKLAFALVEILVVIGMLTVLFAIVLIAINPAKQFSQANNTQRRNDVSIILNAIHQYAKDNEGNLPAKITTTATNMGSGATDIDICADLVPTYMVKLPVDPSDGSYADCTDYDTKYNVSKSLSTNRVTVAAANSELGETISITK